jgi:hypothetical protein
MLECCHKIAEDHGLVIEAAGWHNVDIGFSFEPVFRVSSPLPMVEASISRKTCSSCSPSGTGSLQPI